MNLESTTLALTGLLLSFFFSGSEAAFNGFNKLHFEIWRKQNNFLFRWSRIFLDRTENYYTTILIGNNFANSLFTSFATIILVSVLDEFQAWLLITFVLLTFGEIIPKTSFLFLADYTIKPVLLINRLTYLLFLPLNMLMAGLSQKFLKMIGIDENVYHRYFSREDLRNLLVNEEILHEHEETRFIRNILNFSHSQVREAMVPRTEIHMIPETASWEEACDLMYNSGRRRLPVFSGHKDNILGFIYIYDLLTPQEDIHQIIRPVRFVPESKNSFLCFRELQAKGESIAIVVDEHGGTAGIVTHKDLAEELFGRVIWKDDEKSFLRRLNQNTYLLAGQTELEELELVLPELELPEGDYETLGGFILTRLGRIPKPGDIIHLERATLQVMAAGANRIRQVKIILHNQQ